MSEATLERRPQDLTKGILLIRDMTSSVELSSVINNFEIESFVNEVRKLVSCYCATKVRRYPLF